MGNRYLSNEDLIDDVLDGFQEKKGNGKGAMPNVDDILAELGIQEKKPAAAVKEQQEEKTQPAKKEEEKTLPEENPTEKPQSAKQEKEQPSSSKPQEQSVDLKEEPKESSLRKESMGMQESAQEYFRMFSGQTPEMLKEEKRKAKQEKKEQERQERERLKQEKLEREKQECERLEQEKLEREKQERERLEQEKLEREKQECERLEQEKLEREKQECERLERENLEHEKQQEAILEEPARLEKSDWPVVKMPPKPNRAENMSDTKEFVLEAEELFSRRGGTVPEQDKEKEMKAQQAVQPVEEPQEGQKKRKNGKTIFDLQLPEEKSQEQKPQEQETKTIGINRMENQEEFKKFFTSRVGTMELDAEPVKKSWFQSLRGKQRIEEDGEAYMDLGEKEWSTEPTLTETDIKKKLHVQSTIQIPQEETGEVAAEEEAEDDYIDDYNSLADAETIRQDLKSMKTGLLVRTVITGILALLMFCLGLSAAGILPELFGISAKNPIAFLLVQGGLLLLASLVSLRTIAGGITGLWDEPSADSLAAVSVLGSLLQILISLFVTDHIDLTGVTVFAPLAVLCLAINALGKWMFSRTMVQNFALSTAQDEYAAAFPITESRLTHKVTEGLAEPEPRLLVSRPTALVKGFLKQSFSERDSDRSCRKLSLAVLGIALLSALLAWIFGNGAIDAANAFAAAACLGAPLAATLVSALPNMLMQQAAAQVGAVIPGWSAMKTLEGANVVTADVKDIFPTGYVRLGGIKTFSKERIDLAILYAASILVEGCSTLRDIFLQVIEGNTGMLYPVENLTSETGCGFEGWIENNRVIVGNRHMMELHNIDIPSLDYEGRYTSGGKQPVYLAVSGKLFGMFLVSYHADAQVARVLDQLSASGISLMVHSDDFSVTAEVIENVYNLAENSVKVLSAEDERALEPCLSYLPESDGVMTHIGTFTSFVGGLRAAAAGVSAEKISTSLLTAASVLGMVLVLILTITKRLVALTLPAVLLLQLAWLVLTLAGPLFKKYK